MFWYILFSSIKIPRSHRLYPITDFQNHQIPEKRKKRELQDLVASQGFLVMVITGEKILKIIAYASLFLSKKSDFCLKPLKENQNEAFFFKNTRIKDQKNLDLHKLHISFTKRTKISFISSLFHI
jgi:hypothetical protein